MKIEITEEQFISGVNQMILQAPDELRNQVSDGYHSFGELYDHRIMLFITLCRATYGSWRSLYHSDETKLEGWFIMGIGKNPGEQITYHIPEKYWKETSDILTLNKAPNWDGHNSADVLERLKKLT